MLASREWHPPKYRPCRPNQAWLAHGLPPRAACFTGSAPNGSGPLRGRRVNRSACSPLSCTHPSFGITH